FAFIWLSLTSGAGIFSLKLPLRSLRRIWLVVKALTAFSVYIILASFISSKIVNFPIIVVVTAIFATFLVTTKTSLLIAFQKPFSSFGRYVFSVLIIYAIIGGYVYATSVYGNIPRYLGGGQPISAMLIFKDEAALTQLGFTPDSAKSNYTQNVVL